MSKIHVGVGARDDAILDLSRAVVRLEAANARLRAACEDCLEIMEIVYPHGLPIQQGTLCEEDQWKSAVRKAKAALEATK